MKQIIISTFSVLAFCLILSCSSKEEHTQLDQSHSSQKVKSELVREGVINVESIDANKDGNIYECPMDWNVISDEAGDCPVCGMKLKEYSLDETKKNLEKFGHQAK